MAFRDLIGFINHCSLESASRTGTCGSLSLALFSIVFSGEGHVLNSSLALKQFSFTHVGQVLRLRRYYTIS